MLMVEFLDAIPEAAVIAISVLEGSIGWSLVIAIFMLNITSGLATFTDLIRWRTWEERKEGKNKISG